MPSSFANRLRAVQQAHDSVVCVGLDPDPERLPAHLTTSLAPAEAVLRFNRAIIDATHPYACAYKLNFAFYEALGGEGWDVLRSTVEHVPDDVLVIADAKRGDIGNSARFYARGVFEELGCDAVTVSPYMGPDSVAPFLNYAGTCTFVLARTSNAGANEVQAFTQDGTPLYRHVATRAAAWAADAPGTAGLVAGATDVDALADLRRVCPTLPFLIPGVGAQGGDPEAVMRAASTEDGLVLVNSSRSILYASEGGDFAEAAARAAGDLREKLRR